MTLVNDILDEFNALAAQRIPWERYWRDIGKYVLPQTEMFDTVLSSGYTTGIIDGVVGTPVASKASPDLYDMTSLWGVERLTAGLLSLKTPETETWHNLNTDDMFGRKLSHGERLAMERLRDYLFKVRANPKSGFWVAHKAALKSMCAFGDGWLFVKDNPAGGAKTPYLYEYLPLHELYPSVDVNGVPNGMRRLMRKTALQLAQLLGAENLPGKVLDMANDPVKQHMAVPLLQSVRPREDTRRTGKVGVAGSTFASYYVFPEEKHLASESGYFEFPFSRYAWAASGTRPYSEGPIAYALGEIKSMQVMGQHELIGVQGHLRPSYAVHSKNTKLNLNPGAVNPGLISPDGKPLFQSLTPATRPDFAQAVMEARRNSVRELLYLNLWQIILPDAGDTATEALIRAQEKGDLLGPVGISLNHGLSMLVDREVAILGRRGAFDSGSPLEMPDGLRDQEVAPVFTSPLDRLRRMSELIGVQRLIELLGTLEQFKPGVMARLDVDEIADLAQEILGAPVRVLASRETAKQARDGLGKMQETVAALKTMQAGGDAARAVGEGTASLAGGAETLKSSKALGDIAKRLPQITQMAGSALGNAA